jgi:hypothetical protein
MARIRTLGRSLAASSRALANRACASAPSGASAAAHTSFSVLLGRDSESRHAVGAKNEIPDIAEYSGGQSGFFQIWSTRAKRVLARGRSFWVGTIGGSAAAHHLQACPRCAPGPGRRRPDPACRPRRARSAPRERSARAPRARPRTEPGPPALRRAGSAPSGPRRAPGCRGGIAPDAGLRAHLGLALGISKTAAFRHLSAMRQCGVAEQAGTGRGAGWRLAPRPDDTRRHYTTIEDLAQAVHDGLVEADDEQRAVLEQALQIASRPRPTLLRGGGHGGQ